MILFQIVVQLKTSDLLFEQSLRKKTQYCVPSIGKARLSIYLFSNTIEHRIFYAMLPRSRGQHFEIYYFHVLPITPIIIIPDAIR